MKAIKVIAVNVMCHVKVMWQVGSGGLRETEEENKVLMTQDDIKKHHY